ncbi:hypothetical protein ACWGQ2_07245 [Arthrobacter sp. NPDC055585]
MEIGSKAKKIIVWIASGLAAAGLLTGTFFTGMAVADNTEPASVTSELDGERPERPERGDHSDLPRDSERQDSDSQDGDSQEKDAQKNDGGEGTDEARPERPDHDGGPDHDGKPGRDDSGRDDSGKQDARDGRGERGGDGHRHGHPDSEEEAPAEDAPAQS